MMNRFRLDRTVEPQVYDLTLTPDLQAFTFAGEVTITARITNATRQITLHAAELALARAAVRRQGRSAAPVAASRITYNAQLQTATLHFARPVAPGTWLLSIEFTGLINDKMRGFYRTSYHVNGVTRWGGATQFEATDARHAFPCWDEPDRKARFRLTLRVPKALTALSNMPIARERAVPGGALKALTYQPTVVMSTYLLAWVIADLESVEGKDPHGVPIRIWTTPGKKAQGAFALEVGKRALAYFRKWFGIRYALPKLDMVALPDFASGAMENWGLVTYRETALLVDPVHSSAQARQRVAEVIAHELAHQWFGNLVTMAWWTDLWLNEGFASYMGPKAVDAQFPDWAVWSQFLANDTLLALHDDSLEHTHPIEIPVEDPHEIREIFDHITYSKGSSVNRMLEHYLTEPVFRRGLSAYLKRYAFKNARTQDLWTALERASGKPVNAIMASFTKQPGYPVVSVSETADRKGLLLTQRRFYSDGRERKDGAAQWSVPVVIAAPDLKQPHYGVLRAARAVFPVRSSRWIKVNAGQSGFYRTAYAPELLARLGEAVARQELPVLDVLGLLDDTFALARAGVLRTSQALQLALDAGGTADYNVWAEIAGTLAAVELIVPEEPASIQLTTCAANLFGPLLQRIGWERRPADGHLDALLRSLVIGRMGHYGDPAVIGEARERFAGFLKRGGALAPDLRGAVYATVARHGGAADYDRFLGLYRRSDLQEERVRILRALTHFRQPSLIRRALALALSPLVRKQDAFIILGGSSHNPVARPLAWAFVKAQWKTLLARYSDGGLNLMTRVIEGATAGFTTEQAHADVRRFFLRHRVPGAERTVKQALEVIEATIRWERRDRADIRAWLASKTF